MIGFVLGMLFGAAIASGSLYAIYLWIQPEEQPDNTASLAANKAPPPLPAAKVEPAAQVEPAAEPAAVGADPGVEAEGAAATEREWIGDLSERIQGEIGSHSFRLEEISARLRAAKEGEPDMVLDAASRMMLANRQLQSELEAARAEIAEHREKVKELAVEARTDVLTGLANRRAFTEDLERRIEQWRRHEVPLSLVMLDIDHFKSINDRYTHAGGDAALRHLGDVLRGALRQMDIPARYGGEEFAVLLPGTRLDDAINVAERLRATLAASAVEYEGQTIPMTASLGLATAAAGETAVSLVERADQALYAAKESGRNRAFLHDCTGHMPIESDKALVRHPFRNLQQIAPYKLGGPLPTASDFCSVRCYDLSVRGISFLTSASPDYQALVIQLGHPPAARYMISSVANVASMVEGEEQVYRVGCTFVSRLDPEEILSGPNGTPAETADELAGVA